MKLDDAYVPRIMMVVYSNSEDGRHSGLSDHETYVETAPVVNGKPAAFVPMSEKVASELAVMLTKSSRKEVGGFIPRGMLYSSFNGAKASVMWHTPPQKKKLLYSPSFKMGNITIMLPRLLWYFKGDNLSLFALKDLPTPKAVLYNAPFCNIDTGGRVCLGAGTKVIKNQYTSFTELIKSVESAFWGTYFTNENHETILSEGKNLMSLHKELAVSGAAFHEEMLKPNSSYKTVNSLANEKANKYAAEDDDELDFPDEDE